MRKYLFFLYIILFFSCQNPTPVSTSNYSRISGETMGTTYHITYEDSLNRNFKPAIDSILLEINQGVSTYIADSDISKFNTNQQTEFKNYEATSNYFLEVYFSSQEVFEKTEGYFDPTVMPLVNYWGFGYQEKKPVTETDKVKVAELQKLVGLNKIKSECKENSYGHNCTLSKSNPSIQLDFSANAKGYAVDVLASFLRKNKSKNYLVEIGGELIARGKNPKGKTWSTAINTPKINAQLTDYEAILEVEDKAIATSGNYRNFHEVNGEWYGHEINPKTGFPEKSKLLSATVMANDCMSADAYATAMMVMGLDKSKALAEKLYNVDALFIFANEAGDLETTFTDGFKNTIRE